MDNICVLLLMFEGIAGSANSRAASQRFRIYNLSKLFIFIIWMQTHNFSGIWLAKKITLVKNPREH